MARIEAGWKAQSRDYLGNIIDRKSYNAREAVGEQESVLTKIIICLIWRNRGQDTQVRLKNEKGELDNKNDLKTN